MQLHLFTSNVKSYYNRIKIIKKTNVWRSFKWQAPIWKQYFYSIQKSIITEMFHLNLVHSKFRLSSYLRIRFSDLRKKSSHRSTFIGTKKTGLEIKTTCEEKITSQMCIFAHSQGEISRTCYLPHQQVLQSLKWKYRAA